MGVMLLSADYFKQSLVGSFVFFLFFCFVLRVFGLFANEALHESCLIRYWRRCVKKQNGRDAMRTTRGTN